MRLLIDLQGAQATHQGRGIGRYALSLALALLRQGGGHDIHLLLNGHYPGSVDAIGQAVAGLLPPDRLHVWQAVEPLQDGPPENAGRRQFAQQLRNAVIASINPDKVLITSLFEGPGNAAVVTIDPQGPPTAVVLYDLIPLMHPDVYLGDPGTLHWYEGRLQELRKAQLLLSISEHSRTEAIDHLSWPQDRVVNISTACDDTFVPAEVPQAMREDWAEKYGLRRPFLMYTGGIDRRKNIERLIRAYALLEEPLRLAHQLVIVCAASPEDRQRLQEQAVQAGLQDDELVITGFVPEQELVALYNACKAFVFPSWHEGFGLPVLEAMRCGKAVIASGTTSLPEVVGLTEALFDPLDEQDMHERIQWVLSNPVARQRLEQHARIQCQKFSWDLTARKTLEALETCAVPPAPIACAGKPRLACISPLPPEQSGISDYTVQLLKALATHYDIEVIVHQDQVSDPWVLRHCPVRSVDGFLQNHWTFDRVLYHFGNSHFHDHMLDLLQRVPGVVVLHDYYLSGLQAHHLRGMDNVPWQRMLHACHGYPALLADRLPGDRKQVIWHYPCNLDVLEHATGIIVHSEFSRRLASQWLGPGAADTWRVIPLLREAPAIDLADRQQARKQLGLPADAFVVCSFGLIGEHKLNLDLVEAFKGSSLAQEPSCMLIFVGENDAGPFGKTLMQRIEQSGLQQRIRITGWTDAQDYQQYLAAADVGVQLRTRSRGETSAAVLDCMRHGLPTIVNANGSMADLDSTAVYLLPDAFGVHELAFALETLWQQPGRREQLGDAARRLLTTRHAPAACAQAYRQAIEHFHQAANLPLQSLLEGLRLMAADQPAFARALSANFAPTPRPRQLLVDISELVRQDARTGIQRVTRAILNEWLRKDFTGWRIEPVWAVHDRAGYRYARQFTSRLLGLPQDWAEDAPVQAWAGDVFLGLDLQPHVVPAQRPTLRQWRRQGARVCFVVYDLLPVQHPHFFVPDAAQGFTPWLQTVAECDAAFCISRSTRNALQDWLEQQPVLNGHQPALDWFHLGADVEQSLPTQGLPENTDLLLDRLQHIPGFLMVGTLEPRKGHSQVLEAFECLWQQGHDLLLVIVGKRGWMVDELAKRLTSHPQSGHRLFWLQAASDECLGQLYRISAALVAASYAEGFGLPLIEAARHGCPVLARDIPVFREIAEDNAFYFSAQTGAQLAQELLTWLALRAQGREPFSGHMHMLTWRQSARRLLELACMDEPVPEHPCRP